MTAAVYCVVVVCVGSGFTWLAESVASTGKSNTICFARQRHSCSCPDRIWEDCYICYPYSTESPVHKTGGWHVVIIMRHLMPGRYLHLALGIAKRNVLWPRWCCLLYTSDAADE